MLTQVDFWKSFTLLLGCIVAWISYSQHKVNKEKFKLDLFDMRFSVFSATRRILSAVFRDYAATNELLNDFRRSTAEATFLFDDDIAEFLNEIDEKLIELISACEGLHDSPIGETKDNLLNEKKNAARWLRDQLPLLEPKFSRYLKFRTWR